MKNVGEQACGPRACALGFSLIETVIAIVVIAVTFIGLIGLLGLGVANDQRSSEQTVANNIAASILADLRSTPAYPTPTTSTRYKLTLPIAAPASSTAPLSGLTASVLYFDNSPVFISLNPARFLPMRFMSQTSISPGLGLSAQRLLCKATTWLASWFPGPPRRRRGRRQPGASMSSPNF